MNNGNSYSMQSPECGPNTLMFTQAYDSCVCSWCIHIVGSSRLSVKIGFINLGTLFSNDPFLESVIRYVHTVPTYALPHWTPCLSLNTASINH